VLLVGAGGLGCPAAAYLAGAGVGTLGVMDGDVVEASNLHRQIGHATARLGAGKADSLITHLRGLNPLPTYVAHPTALAPDNAVAVVRRYDLVLDCTDNPASRYLVSDACVALRRPLVSASALRSDGQLMVLNCPAAPRGDVAGGPCYRCVFPKPPPPEAVVSCGEGGILGPVVGVMGVLQALEAIRVIVAGLAPVKNGREPLADGTRSKGGEGEEEQTPRMLLFSASAAGPSFRTVRMRGRRKDCLACGMGSALTPESLTAGSIDYVQFCGGNIPSVDLLPPEQRVSPADFQRLYADRPRLVLDVREREHFAMGSIDGAINVPFSTITREAACGMELADTEKSELGRALKDQTSPIFVVCRVGNDSQIVAEMIKNRGLHGDEAGWARDIKGGMMAWKAEVDETMPYA